MMKCSCGQQDLYKVSLGLEAPDIVIENALLFNSITGEFLPDSCLWIKDGHIAYAGPPAEPRLAEHTLRINADSKVVIPGLIEAHTHVMSLVGLEEFTRFVIPSGTTTVVTETIELASIAGEKGFDYFIEALKIQPLRYFYTISPLCGLTPDQEVFAPPLEVYKKYLEDPFCLGLGEIYWANSLLDNEQGKRVRELATLTLACDKRVQGHTAGASGGKLQAYTALGATSCHEPITEEEVLSRLRLGYWVMIRQGAVRKELERVAGIFFKEIDKRRLVISTDSMAPEGFLTEGSLDAAVRHALELGIPPNLVYQSVTINAAEHFHLDHLIGSLCPGRAADLVIIPSQERYQPELVMCKGKIIFEDGEAKVAPQKAHWPDELFRTVIVTQDQIKLPPGRGKVRAMELVTRLVTREAVVDLDNPSDAEDVLALLALERTGKGESFSGYLKGFGLREGAFGSTMCWDSTDLIVIGRDQSSIQTVVGRLEEIQGGTVLAVGKQVLAEYPAPLCGIVTLDPMETARDRITKIERILRELGVKWENPFLTLLVMGTAAIPHIRITHKGYVRLRDRALLGIEPD